MVTNALPRVAVALAVTLALSFGLAACGDDDDTGTDTTTSAATGGDETASVETFCDSYVDANIAFGTGPDVDFETATEEEVQEALATFSDLVNPLMDDALASAPAEVEADVESVVATARQAVETGDDSAFESDEFGRASANVDDYILGNCDLEVVEVTAVDYAFEGLASTVPAGRVALVFENEGNEVHEIGLARINDDVTESAEEILALGEEEAEGMLTFVGGGFAFPGDRDVVYIDLSAGRYAAACFIPVGSTPEVAEADEEPEGPPHFTQGMVANFEVR